MVSSLFYVGFFIFSPIAFGLLVEKSLILNSLIGKKKAAYFQRIRMEVNPEMFNGFLITFQNQMEFEPESCAIFDSLALLEINERNVSFGCSHYLVLYVPSPLTIRIVPNVLRNLQHLFTIVVTGVRLSCSEYNPNFKRCPNHLHFCIPRELFCDGVDNCGLNSDESNCMEPQNRIFLDLIDNQNYVHASVALAAIATIATVTLIVTVFLYKWYLVSRHGYSSKYVKRFFGGHTEPPSNFEAEETVALLTLGLKNMVPHMPRRMSHYHSLRYGTRF